MGDNLCNSHRSLILCSVSLQGEQQVVYGDAAERPSSPGQPDRWTQIKAPMFRQQATKRGKG